MCEITHKVVNLTLHCSNNEKATSETDTLKYVYLVFSQSMSIDAKSNLFLEVQVRQNRKLQASCI